jgi:hypothetical protein
MSTLAQKFRTTRRNSRDARALSRALANVRSETMRNEILTIAARQR